MKSFWTITLVPWFVLSGLAAPNTRQTAEDDVREAVCRWYLAPPFPDRSDDHRERKVYFLAVTERGDDPSDEFLKRFSTEKSSLRKRSDCKVVGNKVVVDKRTGEHGIILRLGRIRWLTDTEATVHAEYDAEGQNPMVYTCSVINENGKWRVVRAVRGARDMILLANQAAGANGGERRSEACPNRASVAALPAMAQLFRSIETLNRT